MYLFWSSVKDASNKRLSNKGLSSCMRRTPIIYNSQRTSSSKIKYFHKCILHLYNICQFIILNLYQTNIQKYKKVLLQREDIKIYYFHYDFSLSSRYILYCILHSCWMRRYISRDHTPPSIPYDSCR